MGPAVGNLIPPFRPTGAHHETAAGGASRQQDGTACHGQPPAQRRHPESRARWAGAAPAVGPDGTSVLAASPGLWAGLSWGGAHRPGGDRAPGTQPGRALGGGAVAGVDKRAGRQSPPSEPALGPGGACVLLLGSKGSRHMGFRSCSTQAQWLWLTVQGMWNLPDQGSNPCSMH